MNPNTVRQWIDYRQRSITTKAPFTVKQTQFDPKRPLFKIVDRNGINNGVFFNKERAEAKCDKLNLDAAMEVMRE